MAKKNLIRLAREVIMKLDWNNITSDDVYEAIRVFKYTIKNIQMQKNTFIEVNGLYPAKYKNALCFNYWYKYDCKKGEIICVMASWIIDYQNF